MTVGAQQANAPGGGYGYIAPGKVGSEFVAGGKANVIFDEHVPCTAACSEVLQCARVAEEPVGIEFDGGSKSADLDGGSYWRAVRGRWAATNDASRGLTNARVEPTCSAPERELLDLLNERNHVAANLATKAHKTRGTDVNDQVWATAIRVKGHLPTSAGPARRSWTPYRSTPSAMGCC